jgi:hypothetical protein
LRKAVRKNIEGSLKTYAPSTAPQLVKSIRTQATNTKKEMKGVKEKKVFAPVSEKRFLIKTGPHTKFVDLNTGHSKISIAPKAPQLQAMINAQVQHQQKRQADETHSRATLNAMVNPDEEAGTDTNTAPWQPSVNPQTIMSAELGTLTESANELPSSTVADPTPAQPQPPTPQDLSIAELDVPVDVMNSLPPNRVVSKTFNVAIRELPTQQV